MNIAADKELSVLHIVGSSKFGGATMVVFSLVEMARRHGWRTAILSDDLATINECKNRAIEVVEFNGIVRPIRPWVDILATWRLTQLLRLRKDTVIHTHTFKGGLVGRYAANRAKMPIIIHHNHGFSFQDNSSFLRKKSIFFAEKFGAILCDRIISVNKADIEFAIKYDMGPSQKFIYIPNGIDQAKIDNIRPVERSELIKILGVGPSSILMVVVARLFSEKGHIVLFNALKKIQSNVARPIHLILVGDGPHRDKFMKHVRLLGLSNNIHFMGYRTDCISIEKSCDLFVLPSLREGHSITIMEAMAIGIPIVATDIRGINNSVRNGQEALLVPPCDDNALAGAIIQILNDQPFAAQLKHNARKRFLEDFTEEKMLRRVWEVYQELIIEKGLSQKIYSN